MGRFGVRHYILFALLALVATAGIFVVQKTIITQAAPGINKTINFQGKMTDDQGLNVADGTYQFEFRMYTVASGGSATWTETVNLSVTDGIFQHNLGSTTPLPGAVDFDTDNIFLGITFNADPDGEMTPRIQLTATPYAFNSDQLDGLDASDFLQLSPSAAQTGDIAITGSVSAASLVLSDGSSNTATIEVDSLAGDYTYVIPTTTGDDIFCLEGLGNCGGTGVSAIGTLDSQTASANGAVISSSTLYLQSASASNPGVVNTGTQTFAGDKTFGGAVKVGGAANVAQFTVKLNSAQTAPAMVIESSTGFEMARLIVQSGSIGLGSSALSTSSTGSANVAIGLYSMMSNGTGGFNVALGTQSLFANDDGSNNIAVGFGAMIQNQSGNYNVALGPHALGSNSTGEYNIGIGASAGSTIATGSYNIAIGYNAAVDDPDASYQLNIVDLLRSDNYLSGNLVVGASDTTGQLLVLDTKTSSGDPTGINGGMYYNSNDGKFRCYEDGAWKDCISAGTGDIINGGQNGAVTIGTNNSNSLVLETNNTTRVAIEADGDVAIDTNTLFINATSNRVGVGTTSPSTELEVVGDITSTGTKWSARAAAEANSWRSVTYGNGLFVAVAYSGTNRVMTSPDGINWTARAVTTGTWNSVTYGNGLFVAVGDNGLAYVMTSPDGINWTTRTASSGTWISVTYGNGLFVAVASGGTNRVMTSPDGINWTTRTPAEANSWISVTYGNGLFVAVASSGTNRVMTSPDGINWTPQTASATSWQSVTYGNGLYVAVASSGTNSIMTSSNATTWTLRAAPSNGWSSVTYGNGLFVSVATTGTGRVMTSPDGINWTLRTAAEGNSWYAVTYGNDMFVAVASNGTNRVMTSGKANVNTSSYNNIYQGGITVNGAAVFNAAVNSTTSFIIQNSSGSSLFTTDTTNSRISIGTSDTTGTLLVLDTKTSSGDPTGINGGMYYNSNDGKFRCYEDGAWKDCISSGVGTGDIINGGQNGAVTIGSNNANSLVLETNNTARLTISSTGNVTQSGGSLQLSGTSTSNYKMYLAGTVESASGSVYGLQNSVAINASAASGAYGLINTPTIHASSASIADVFGFGGRVDFQSGYAGTVSNAYGVMAFRPSAMNGVKVQNYHGLAAQLSNSGSSGNSDNTSGTLNNYGLRVFGGTAAAGTGGTLNNYGARITLSTGATSGTTNYGLYIDGSGGGSNNWALYSTSTAASLMSGALTVGGQLSVGASNATGTLLVLDTKTGSGDSGVATVNGGMYYNSADGKFRCYENSTWKDCIGGGSGDVLQGGNSFGAALTLGTNDNYGLNLEVANATVASFSATGQATFKNSSNSTTAFQVQASDSSPVITADTTNKRVYVGDPSSTTTTTLLVLDASDETSGSIGATPVIASYTTLAGGSGTSTVLTIPTGTANGDLLVAVINTYYGVPTPTAPAGWTQLATAHGDYPGGEDTRTTVYYRIASSDTPGTTRTWTHVNEYRSGTMLRITGADTATPFNIYAGRTQAADDNISLPSVTTTSTNVLGIGLIGAFGNNNHGSLSGWTSAYTYDDGYGSVYTRSMSTATTYGVATSASIEPYSYVSYVLGINPSSSVTHLDPTGVNGAMYYNANSNKFRCYQNSSWTDCVGGGAGDVSNGGNTTGAALTIGTNDGYGLNLEVNNTTVASFSSTGQALFKNASNSTTGFVVQNAGGDALLTVDTTNAYIMLGDSDQAGQLRINDGYGNVGSVQLESFGVGQGWMIFKAGGTNIGSGSIVAEFNDTFNWTFRVGATGVASSFNYGLNVADGLTVTSGNVGIGTAGVSGRALQVSGIISAKGTSARLQLEPSGGGTTNLWNIDNNAGTMRFFRADYASTGTGSNGVVRLQLNDSGTGTTTIAGTNSCTIGSGTGTTSCTSDARKKHDIQGTTDNLNKILQLNPVSYYWNSDTDNTTKRIGLIAQDVKALFPEAVEVDSDGYYTLDYSVLVSPLIGAIKELSVKVNANTAQISVVQSEVATLTASLSGYATAASIQSLFTDLSGRVNTLELGNVANLSVSGAATIGGDLSVAGVIYATNINLAGKIVTAGVTPSAVLGEHTGTGAVISVTGNDTAGDISLTAGTAQLASGEQFTITFNAPFNAKPRVNLTPTSEDAAKVRYYVEPSTTGFKIVFIDTPLPGKIYGFNYFVVQ